MSKKSKETKTEEKIVSNMESILKKNAEFSWYIFYDGKIKLLTSGSDRNETEKDAIKRILKMAKDRENLIEVNKKMYIYLFNLKKPENSYEKNANKDGRLGFFIERMKTRISKIKDYESSLSLKSVRSDNKYARRDIYWIDDKYLKKNKNIKSDDIEKIFKFIATGSPFAVRILSEVILDNPPKYLTLY